MSTAMVFISEQLRNLFQELETLYPRVREDNDNGQEEVADRLDIYTQRLMRPIALGRTSAPSLSWLALVPSIETSHKCTGQRR
jgi:hemerythrin-like domain-containing protein